MLGQKKQVAIGLDIQKNVIRYSVQKGNRIIHGEEVSNGTFFKNDRLKNTEEFANILRKISGKVHSKNPKFIIAATNANLLIRKIPIQEMNSEKEIREYLYFELGESIPLPFKNPVFELLILENKRQKAKKMPKSKRGKRVAKVSGEAIKVKRNRLSIDGQVPIIITSKTVLEDIGDCIAQQGGQLIGVEYSALAYTRMFRNRINWSQDFLLVEFAAGTATITIFEQLVPVYVQYEEYNQLNWRYVPQDEAVKLDINLATEYDELAKLGSTIQNITHYYESEISPGRELAQIYLVGEHPMLKKNVREIIQEANTLPVKPLFTTVKANKDTNLPDRFLLSAALSMKEV